MGSKTYVMAARNSPNYDRDVLNEMNEWTHTVQNQIRSNWLQSYRNAEVRPLNGEYENEIKRHLMDDLGLDFGHALLFLDRTKMVYHPEEDAVLVSSELLESDFDGEKRALLAHEEGHRLGRNIVSEMLEPVSGEVPETEYDKLHDYLMSDNFAERTKLAIGNDMGEVFEYQRDLVDGQPALYIMKGRLGPESFVDPDRNEDLEDLFNSVEEYVEDILSGKGS